MTPCPSRCPVCPRKRTLRARPPHVRFVPEADISAASFDHLVGKPHRRSYGEGPPQQGDAKDESALACEVGRMADKLKLVPEEQQQRSLNRRVSPPWVPAIPPCRTSGPAGVGNPGEFPSAVGGGRFLFPPAPPGPKEHIPA